MEKRVAQDIIRKGLSTCFTDTEEKRYFEAVASEILSEIRLLREDIRHDRSEDFIYIYDIRDSQSYIININQIAWLDINTKTVMLSASSGKGLFHLDNESMEEIYKAIQKKEQ